MARCTALHVCLLVLLPIGILETARAQDVGIADLKIIGTQKGPRSFILANRAGTYFYGSSSEANWDPGWMGLWVNRKRVQARFVVRDGQGNAIPFGESECVIHPDFVQWTWPGRTARTCMVFLRAGSDTLYYWADAELTLDGGPWIQRSDEQGPDLQLRSQLQSEVSAFSFQCADRELTTAAAWARLHLLSLLAEGDSLLYAGIPWFNEGWGRDTFISLPGLLAAGHTVAAHKLLLRFAGWIDRDPASTTFGRIPNRVRPGEEIAYNTADGTPLWVLGVYQYGVYARDRGIWRTLLLNEGDGATAGALQVAIAGALQHSDGQGFLRHGDGDTWMDAIGPDGPETPRGDRAVEIQALHYAALDAAIRMASSLRSEFPADTLERWRQARRILEQNFLTAYLLQGADGLYDVLSADNQADSKLRPNQLFALTVPLSPLLPPQISRAMARSVFANLIHPYGVLSLAPDEPEFHPYHMDAHYPKDKAYHNGIVWTWLSGPAKSVARGNGRADLALELAKFEAEMILNRGCAGSLAEVTDALPRKRGAPPALSGTVSQAWSLAEFLRTLQQDLLGIRPVFVSQRIDPFWLFDPRVPAAWGRVTARVSLEGTPIAVEIQNFGDSVAVTLRAEREPPSEIGIKVFDETRGVTGFLRGTDPVHLVYVARDSIIYADGAATAQVRISGWPYDAGNRDLRFSRTITRRTFASLLPPPWDILTAQDVLRKAPRAAAVLAAASDPFADDVGNGFFVYPTDEHFLPGILDLTDFSVHEDRKSLYFDMRFRRLAQPGWHPEYGFQLTFAAIVLHDGRGTRRSVGANSQYEFPESRGAARLIYVGGGVRVEDDRGETLAQFTPRALTDALGDTSTAAISFSLPKRYFPARTEDWEWTVLIGAQDDHGGAGMGEFRTVRPDAERWAGGGNHDSSPNVYDQLFIGRQ